jgi:hypothetical protein
VGTYYEGATVKITSVWAFINGQRGDWAFVKAEPPCWKGELSMSFRWFRVVIGWQRRKEPYTETE